LQLKREGKDLGEDLSQSNYTATVLQPAWLRGAELAAQAFDFDAFMEGIFHRGCALVSNRGHPVM
jgi:hypothetical protein